MPRLDDLFVQVLGNGDFELNRFSRKDSQTLVLTADEVRWLQAVALPAVLHEAGATPTLVPAGRGGPTDRAASADSGATAARGGGEDGPGTPRRRQARRTPPSAGGTNGGAQGSLPTQKTT